MARQLEFRQEDSTITSEIWTTYTSLLLKYIKIYVYTKKNYFIYIYIFIYFSFFYSIYLFGGREDQAIHDDVSIYRVDNIHSLC